MNQKREERRRDSNMRLIHDIFFVLCCDDYSNYFYSSQRSESDSGLRAQGSA